MVTADHWGFCQGALPDAAISPQCTAHTGVYLPAPDASGRPNGRRDMHCLRLSDSEVTQRKSDLRHQRETRHTITQDVLAGRNGAGDRWTSATSQLG